MELAALSGMGECRGDGDGDDWLFQLRFNGMYSLAGQYAI